MNNCRRLTRREARIIRNIADVPANRYHPGYFGRTVPRVPLPGKVTAWCNSPATRSKWIDRFAWRAEPILAALLLVLCSLLLMLSITTKVIAK